MISYKLHPYMPRSILVLLIQFMLLLLHIKLSNVLRDFQPRHCQYYFPFGAYFLFIHTQRLVAHAVLARVVTYILR